MNAPGTSACTVTLSGAAPSGGLAVALSSNNANATVPASVTASAGATTVGFTATVGSITANQTATLTATANSTAKTTSLSLVAPAQLSSVSCAPSTLGTAQTSDLHGDAEQSGLEHHNREPVEQHRGADGARQHDHRHRCQQRHLHRDRGHSERQPDGHGHGQLEWSEQDDHGQSNGSTDNTKRPLLFPVECERTGICHLHGDVERCARRTEGWP